MKTQRISLIVSGVLLTVGSPCFAQPAPAVNKSNEDSNKKAAPAPQKEPQVKLVIQEEPKKITYPYGEPLIVENGAKSGWDAKLPGKDLVIKSQWKDEPEFQMEFGPDQKFQGAVSLATVKTSNNEKMPHTLHLLVYIYDPKAIDLDTSKPDSVIDQLITTPAKQAEEHGYTISSVDLGTTRAKLDKIPGFAKEVRKQLSIKQDGEGVQSQFYRLLVGKDYVVLGLVIGGYEELKDDAQQFFDGITIEPKK